MEFESLDAMMGFMRGSRSHFVSITLSQKENPIGEIVLELFNEIAPTTSKHFCDIILGPGEGRENVKHSLVNTPIHRIVKNAFIQVSGMVGTSHISGNR